MARDRDARFTVHPSVLFQLGESLITDSVQALVELVKNCYDADASYAKVLIDTRGKLDMDDARYPAELGRIVVEDDGTGMSEAVIRDSWLVLSSRGKRDFKSRSATTNKGRTPLGDKGLGRLGAQRLGDGIDVFTKSEGESGLHFAFAWSDFTKVSELGGVAVQLTRTDQIKKTGTRVVISALKDPDAWRGRESLKRLERELSEMISPYRAIRDFTVYVEVNGQQLDLVEVSDALRELAPVQYAFKFDRQRLCITGRARLAFFRPTRPGDVEEFALLAEGDGGDALFAYLVAQKIGQSIKLSRCSENAWFVEFSRDIELENLPNVATIDGDDVPTVACPGPFHGEVDSFDLSAEAWRQQGVFDRLQEFRAHVKDLSGIRVYRDGFAIRVDRDWLKLGAQWTSASSYYGLKPDNTLGYVALTARENMALEETTDREGFRDTPYYRNFELLLRSFTRFAGEAQEFLRRAWLDYRSERRERLAMVDSRRGMEDLSRELSTKLASASKRRAAVTQLKRKLTTALRDTRDLSARTSRGARSSARLREAYESLRALVDETRALLQVMEDYLKEIGAVTEFGKVLDQRIRSVRRQMDEMYETMALGLTAEALSHELFQIADGLARRARSVRARLGPDGTMDPVVLKFVEAVRSAVMGLRKQLSYLSPALRYVREQREVIRMVDFVWSAAEFYSGRLERSGITLCPSQPGEDFSVRMNRGKLSQVLDNLILNSEYWLTQDSRLRRVSTGEIHVEVARPFVRVWDNGRGIDRAIEPALFEPFVSTKEQGVGRGLGLFIVKQLLDSEGCYINVLPERNRLQRLYKFQIDFRGAIHG